jgi:hypothetical protein
VVLQFGKARTSTLVLLSFLLRPSFCCETAKVGVSPAWGRDPSASLGSLGGDIVGVAVVVVGDKRVKRSASLLPLGPAAAPRLGPSNPCR